MHLIVSHWCFLYHFNFGLNFVRFLHLISKNDAILHIDVTVVVCDVTVVVCIMNVINFIMIVTVTSLLILLLLSVTAQ